jgi:hypothetical protein
MLASGRIRTLLDALPISVMGSCQGSTAFLTTGIVGGASGWFDLMVKLHLFRVHQVTDSTASSGKASQVVVFDSSCEGVLADEVRVGKK